MEKTVRSIAASWKITSADRSGYHMFAWATGIDDITTVWYEKINLLQTVIKSWWAFLLRYHNMVSQYDVKLDSCKVSKFFYNLNFIDWLEKSKALKLKARSQYLVLILIIPMEMYWSNPHRFFLWTICPYQGMCTLLPFKNHQPIA